MIDKTSKQSKIQKKPSSEPPIFQAIGVIKGVVTFNNEKASIRIGGKKYELRYIPHKRKAFQELNDYIALTNKTNLRLLVYPAVTHATNQETPPLIAFGLVNFDKGDKQYFPEFEDNEFRLCGWWQIIAQCRLPCISVKRNATPVSIKQLKHKKPKHRINLIKPTHVPVLWKEPIVEPFKYNPDADKDEQGKPLFVSIKVKFIPKNNIFSFTALLSLPQKESPKYLKLKNNNQF